MPSQGPLLVRQSSVAQGIPANITYMLFSLFCTKNLLCLYNLLLRAGQGRRKAAPGSHRKAAPPPATVIRPLRTPGSSYYPTSPKCHPSLFAGPRTCPGRDCFSEWGDASTGCCMTKVETGIILTMCRLHRCLSVLVFFFSPATSARLCRKRPMRSLPSPPPHLGGRAMQWRWPFRTSVWLLQLRHADGRT